MNAIERAFAASERSFYAAKAAVGSQTDALLARGPGGGIVTNPDLAKAQTAYSHNRGWVFACVRAIAQRIAAQPVRVGKSGAKPKGTKLHEGVEPFENHPLLSLIHDPSDLFVSWTLMNTTVASMLLTGRCLWWIPQGRKQLLPIPTHWLVGYEGSTRITSWTVRPQYLAEEFEIDADETVHFFLPDPSDPHKALSPLQAAGLAVTIDEQIQISQQSTFRRGPFPSHALILGKDANGMRPRLNSEQQRQLISALNKRYAGAVNHSNPFIVDGVIEDIKTLSTSPKELNWLESSKDAKDRILQIFGVSPYVLGGSEPGSRAASAVAEEHFLRTTVNPLIRLMSESMTEWLSPMFGGGLAIWLEDAQSVDAELDLKRWQAGMSAGATTINEFRSAVLGLDAIEGGDEFAAPPSSEQQMQQSINDLHEQVADKAFGAMTTSIVDEITGRAKVFGDRAFRLNGHGAGRL